jgi:glycosyltransferase involved in cell wall biosynthesis
MTTATILQIIPELDTGGAELSAVEIGEAVVRAGGRCLIATEGGRLEETARAQGAEIIRFPAATKNPLQMRANVGRLLEIVRREDVRLLHARSRAPAWSALWAARRSGLPFVTTYHGAYNEKGPVKRLYNSVMARGDRVIANSRYTAALIRSRYGTPDERLRVIYRGVDRSFDLAQVSGERIKALRARWGVSDDCLVVLQAASLTGWKGQRVLIAAAAELARRGGLANVAVVLAGDPQGRTGYRETLEGEIAAQGLSDYVRLVGHETDMAAAFATAHVSVVASTEPEAFGRAGAEAQALGCPVIATRLGAPCETVLAEPDVAAAQVTGWLVAPGNAVELAAALAAALALTREERDAIGGRAIRNVAENFTLETMKRQTLQVYDELLDAGFCEAFDCAPATMPAPGST